jgi:hypothetical protein
MIMCGNRSAHRSGQSESHETLDHVKECYGLVTLCGWVYQNGYDEDGPAYRSCVGIVTETPRGWECSNGHEHVTAEVRYAEGWDYASDELEAAQLRKYGVQAVAMLGGSI